MSRSLDLAIVSPKLAGIVRPQGSRRTSGLCRALGLHFGVDPVLVRILFIGLGFIGGLGLVLYFWGTVLTPVDGQTQTPLERRAPGFAGLSNTVQVAIIAATCLVCVLGQSSVDAGTSLAVVALAGLMWSRRGAKGAVAGPDVASTELALPVVDLYGPAPELPAATSVGHAEVPPSWWGALAVLAVPAVATTTAIVLGFCQAFGPASLTIASLSMGLATVLWALVVRSGRLPTIVLLIAGILAALTAVIVLGGRP